MKFVETKQSLIKDIGNKSKRNQTDIKLNWPDEIRDIQVTKLDSQL